MTEAFETERLRIRELADDDLEQIFDVYASNPRHLELTSGAGGEPGSFDLAMLRRDVAVARAMPGRHVAGVYLRGTGDLVGALDWMERNLSDGKAWIGLVIVRAERQRRRCSCSSGASGRLSPPDGGGGPSRGRSSPRGGPVRSSLR